MESPPRPSAENESLLEGERLLFPPASPEQQLEACDATIRNLLDTYSHRLNDDQKRATRHLVELTSQCIKSQACYSNEDLALQLIKTTVNGALNTLIIDEMHPFGRREIGERSYGREGPLRDLNNVSRGVTDFLDQHLAGIPREVSRIHYLPVQEMPAIASRVTAITRTVQNIEELATAIQEPSKNLILPDYHISQPMDIAQIQEAILLRGTHAKSSSLMLPFKLSTTHGGYIFSGTRANKIDEKTFLQSDISRQDIFEAMLNAGLPLINTAPESPEEQYTQQAPHEKQLAISEADAKKQLELIWNEFFALVPLSQVANRISVKQAAVYALSSSIQTHYLAGQLRRKLTESYRQLIGREYISMTDEGGEPHSPDIYLTRSGVSAVAVTIRSAMDYLGPSKDTRPLAHIDQGFYFENAELAVQDFLHTPSYLDPAVQVYCIGASPSGQHIENKSNAVFEARRDDIVRHALQSAATTPQKQYFLIIDKTTDLLYQTFKPKQTLPANLHIFEAASLTKHRRGDTRHFSGVIAHYGSKVMQPIIENSLVHAHATVSDRDLHFFHNVQREEVLSDMQELQIQSDAFTAAFTTGMQEIPEAWRWEVQHSTDAPQYVFLIPPMTSLLNHLAQEGGSRQLFYDLDSLEGQYKHLRSEYVAYLKFWTGPIAWEAIEQGKITRGDSFGLNDTRIATVQANFSYEGHKFQHHIQRVSFGLQSTKSATIELARMMVASQKEFIEETSVDNETDS